MPFWDKMSHQEFGQWAVRQALMHSKQKKAILFLIQFILDRPTPYSLVIAELYFPCNTDLMLQFHLFCFSVHLNKTTEV